MTARRPPEIIYEIIDYVSGGRTLCLRANNKEVLNDRCGSTIPTTADVDITFFYSSVELTGSCHKRQKPQAPTPRAPIRNRQTRKVANAKGLNRNTNLT